MLDLLAVFEAVDEVPDRAVEQHRGPGRGKRRGILDAAAAEVIGSPLRQEGEPADRAVRGSNGRASGQTALAEVDRAGIGDECLARMAEGREEDVE